MLSSKAEWLCVILALTLTCAFYAATQPVAANEAQGGEGQALHAMAKALPRQLPDHIPAPYAARVGLPFSVAVVSKSLDWVISAGFDRLNFAFNAASVILLSFLLRQHVKFPLLRVSLVILFLIEPHSPVRLSYVHPVSGDAARMAFMLAGLVAILWFERGRSIPRAAVTALLVSIGVLFHEGVLLIGVCTLFARRPGSASGGRATLAELERSGAWLPIFAGLMVLLARTSLIPGWTVEFRHPDLLDLTVFRYVLAWFLVFGVLLIVPALRWRETVRFLGGRPVLIIYISACALFAVNAGHPERTIALATPVVLILAGRALSALASPGLPMTVLGAQALFSRIFTPIGGPIETPSIAGEVWERVLSARVTWALSYANMWSRQCATAMLAVYAAAYSVAGALLMVGACYGSRVASWVGRIDPERPLTRSRPWSMGLPGVRYGLVIVGTLALVAPVVWLSGSGVYARYYTEPSLIYIPYNAARVLLLVVIPLICWVVGSRVIRLAGGTTVPQGVVVDALFCGAAIWSIGVVGLGAAGLYHPAVILTLVAAATALAVHDLVKALAVRSPRVRPAVNASVTNLTLGSIALIHFMAILLGIVLWGHFGGDNDVPGTYLPYYDALLKQGSIAPNQYWVHFFASKGNGLALLANALSDVQGSGIATFAVILMGAALLVRLGLRRGVPLTAALIALCLYLQFFGGQGAYAKPHIIRNILICYLVISATESLWSGRAMVPVARMMVIAAVLVLSPLAVIILLPVLIAPHLLALTGERRPRPDMLLEPAWAILIAAIVCGYNYFSVGLIELHSMPASVGQLVNIERLRRWLDPGLAFLDYRLTFLQSALTGAPGPGDAVSLRPTESIQQVVALLLPIGVIAFMVLGVFGAFISAARRDDADGQRASTALAMMNLGAALVTLIALRMFGGGPGSSMARFTDFAVPLALAAGVLGLVAAQASIRQAIARPAFNVLIVAVGLWAVVAGFGPIGALPWRQSVAFALGRNSYASMTSDWGTPTAAALSDAAPDGSRIELLTFLPGFSALPDARFERQDGASYLRSYTQVLFGSADAAAQQYAEAGINYFLFDLSPTAPILWSGFGELFTAESIARRMRIVTHYPSDGHDFYLTTWRADGPADDDVRDLAARWAAKVAIEKQSGQYYGAFAFAREQLASR